MIIEECEQYSGHWWAMRSGIPTASCFDQILTPKEMKPSKSQQKYMYTLAGERIAGINPETYTNAHMERGKELEEEARNYFQVVMNKNVRQVGLIFQDQDKRWSCSPDGLLETEGLEIKCPAMHTHIGYLLDGSLPREYIPQVQGSMMITGFSHWWFLSYYPGLKPLILKVPRDDKWCSALKVELDTFCKRLSEVEKKLREL